MGLQARVKFQWGIISTVYEYILYPWKSIIVALRMRACARLCVHMGGGGGGIAQRHASEEYSH